MAFQFAALAPFIKPMLVGAGVGALGGLLTGQDPLKAAAVGGATAGLFQGLPAGSWMGGGAEVAKSAPTGMGVSLAPASFADDALSLSPTLNSAVPTGMGIDLTQGVNLSNINAPYTGFSGGATGELGANMAFNPSNGLGMPTSVFTSGKGSIDNLAQYSTGSGADIMAKQPTMWDEISPYMNVRDLTGAGLVAAQYQQRPQLPTAPAGGIQRGQAPQGTDVMALLAGVKPREQRRISLL
jgi:hypothetical protein